MRFTKFAKGGTTAQKLYWLENAYNEIVKSMLSSAGVWEPEVTYQQNDIVSYSEFAYLALMENTGARPDVSTTVWQVFSIRGPIGPQGIQGEKGDKGDNGVKGDMGAIHALVNIPSPIQVGATIGISNFTVLSDSLKVGDITLVAFVPIGGGYSTGDLCQVVSNVGGFVILSAAKGNIRGPLGAKGDKGDKGEKGDKGDSGDSSPLVIHNIQLFKTNYFHITLSIINKSEESFSVESLRIFFDENGYYGNSFDGFLCNGSGSDGTVSNNRIVSYIFTNCGITGNGTAFQFYGFNPYQDGWSEGGITAQFNDIYIIDQYYII